MVKKPLQVVRGLSTMELLIAFAILTLTLTAVVSLMYGNQSVAIDTQMSDEALARANREIEKERVLAQSNYLSASSTSSTETYTGTTYTLTMQVTDITPCKKIATSTVSWTQGPLRSLSTSLTVVLTDVAGALALGNDCPTDAPTNNWNNPTRFASDTVNPGKPLALDVLNRVVYMAIDKTPFLKIANTTGAVLGQTSGLFVTYTNSFVAGTQINALDSISWTNPATGAVKKYVYAAMNSPSNQLEVYDVTVPTAPVKVATVGLSSCVKNSQPEGWYVVAYGNRLYLTTRETSGPELHVFDISTPSSPTELAVGSVGCKGFEMNDTVEQFLVRDQVVGGVTKRYLFSATDENNKEIRVLDITNPLNITEATNIDLPGVTDGQSVYISGSRLYFGRLSTAGGPELYIYNAFTPASLSLLGSQEIGTDVLGIRVTGPYAFLATGKTNQEFQVWNVSNPSSISSVAVYNFGNIVGTGIDYEQDPSGTYGSGFIYSTGQASPNLQILYSP